MKVAIGHKIQQGPYGGGNAFVQNIARALEATGHQVVYDLRDKDIDIIMMTDPRWRSPNISFAAGAILRYLSSHNPDALVVHRINECDERKKTRTMNLRLRLANYCADHTVFVGSWLKDLNIYRRMPNKACSVILNGGDVSVFNSQGYRPWPHTGPIRLVTHHWGNHWQKGFDVYAKLDAMLKRPEWRDRFSFTYIGKIPDGFCFQHAQYIEPLSGVPLANALRQNHVYLTASINEPGGNHQVEGGLCGLPLIYRNSGCMPEYCDSFGVMFEGTNIVPALENMEANYDSYCARMDEFPHRAERTAEQFMTLFTGMQDRRSEYLVARRERKSLFLEATNRIPI